MIGRAGGRVTCVSNSALGGDGSAAGGGGSTASGGGFALGGGGAIGFARAAGGADSGFMPVLVRRVSGALPAGGVRSSNRSWC